MTFVQICESDWLFGRKKGSIFVKMFKNLLLRNHIWDESETWHTCLGHYPLHKLCFLFLLDKNSHRLIMGKVEIEDFCQVIGDILIFFYRNNY